MREQLIMLITNFLKTILKRHMPPSPEEKPEGEVKNCPICGEVWEEGADYCYFCGYQLSDENIPLHPPPVRTGVLTDTDGKIPEPARTGIAEKLKALARNRGWDIAVFIVPENLSNRHRLGTENGRAVNLDGLAFCLYNTWRMGKETGLKGILLAIDPLSSSRALVLGRKGPKLNGRKFTEWYNELKNSNISELDGEIEFLAGKMAEI